MKKKPIKKARKKQKEQKEHELTFRGVELVTKPTGRKALCHGCYFFETPGLNADDCHKVNENRCFSQGNGDKRPRIWVELSPRT